MPRHRREDAPGSIQHVWARGIEGRAIFLRDGDRHDLLERLIEVLTEAGALGLAWAFMTNHVHLLLRTGPIPLGMVMRRIHTGFAVRFNLRYQRTGYLFQGRYGSRRVHDDDGLRAAIRYVLRNPLEGALVRDLAALERFPWCGYGALLDLRPALPFEGVAETLSVFGETPEAARAGLRDFMAAPIEAAHAPASAADARLVALARAVCREYGVSELDLREGRRSREVSRARAELCRRAVTVVGLRPAAVARGLGLSESAVSQALHRAGGGGVS